MLLFFHSPLAKFRKIGNLFNSLYFYASLILTEFDNIRVVMSGKAFVPGFKHDIFISYAHVDNLTASQEKGWVTRFHEHLEVRLAKRFGRANLVDIWRDDEDMERGELFDEKIQNAINDSAIFICLNSVGHMNSRYCQDEIDWFYDKAGKESQGLTIDSRYRIINCLLNKISHREWNDKLGRTSGYPFHDAEKGSDEIGEPTEPGSDLFNDQMKDLVKFIHGILTGYKEKALGDAPAAVEELPTETTTPDKKGAGVKLYMGIVADTLWNDQQRLVTELKEKGYEISGPILPGSDKYEDKLKGDLKDSFLAVHLLDQLPGMPVMGGKNGQTHQQLQVEFSLKNCENQYIWIPKSLDIPSVDNQQHRDFLARLEDQPEGEGNYSFVRSSPTALSRNIIEQIDRLKQPPTEADGNGKIQAVLLDTHVKDQLHTLELNQFLMEKQITPFVVYQDDNPENTMSIFEKTLSKTLEKAGIPIIFFGQVSKDWVSKRLEHIIKTVVSKNLELEECAIYLAPPEKPDISFVAPFLNVRLLDNTKGFNPDTFAPLLGGA